VLWLETMALFLSMQMDGLHVKEPSIQKLKWCRQKMGKCTLQIRQGIRAVWSNEFATCTSCNEASKCVCD
jgi:hypothetical protein